MTNDNVAMLTVITPTYNRAHTLDKCYKSLCNQTDLRFIWMIIDDGSNDETDLVVKKWIDDKQIRIVYEKKENGGKASALNKAISILNTEYAVCLDSDDIFYNNTVELALKRLELTNNDERSCGILALRNNPDGTVMGNKEIPSTMETITAKNVFLDLELKTELICFYKSKLLKKYQFPQFENEKFVSPAWLQYKITEDFYFYTSWDKLCCCEYVMDGLTRNKKKIIIKNPQGYTCVKRISYMLSPSLKKKIKNGIMYEYGCILCKKHIFESPNIPLSLFLRPLAFLVYLSRSNL